MVKKLEISCCLDDMALLKFHWNMVQTFSRNVWRDFRLPVSALETVTRKFNGKFTAKTHFTIGHFMSPLPIVSPYIIWKVFGPHAGEMWTKSYGPNHTKFCAFDKKWSTIFDKVLKPFWKTFPWLKQLFAAKISN